MKLHNSSNYDLKYALQEVIQLLWCNICIRFIYYEDTVKYKVTENITSWIPLAQTFFSSEPFMLIFESTITWTSFFICSKFFLLIFKPTAICKIYFIGLIFHMRMKTNLKILTTCTVPRTPTQELRQYAKKYCYWEIMFIVWTVHASLSATPPTPLFPMSSPRRGMHRFAPTTVLDLHTW
jgi:hypothetical protein